MSRLERFVYIILATGGLFLTIVFGYYWFFWGHIPDNFGGTGVWLYLDPLLFITLTYIVWLEIVQEVFAWYIAAFIKHPGAPIPPKEKLRVACLTAFVPASEPYELLEKTLAGMVAVDYPHDTWLLDEGDDATAKSICKKYGVYHYSRYGKEHYNTEQGKFKRKTKAGNYNSWLHQYSTQYDIIAQHDVDFIPHKGFLTRTLGYFNDPSVGFVGTPQVYKNLSESWIARGAAEQTWGFYGFFQQGLHGRDTALLIGANHILRMAALEDIDGYSPHLAEDMLTGMRVYTKKWRGVYVPETLLLGEGPATWASYFTQQMRWSFGCMDIVFRHSPRLFRKMSFTQVFNYIWIQQFYFTGLAQAAGIVLLTLYFFFGISATRMTVWPVFMLWVLLMAYQITFQAWLQHFNVNPEQERGFLLRGRIMFVAAWPIYLLAFIGVIRGKKITYSVTPKGANQFPAHNPEVFIPHFVLGTITLVDFMAGVVLKHTSAILIFWALLNTLIMYGLFFSEAMPTLWEKSTLRALLHDVVRQPAVVPSRVSSVATQFASEYGTKDPR